MVLTLYYMHESPPCRAVMMLISHLKLEDVEMKYINLATGQHLTDEDLGKANPRRLVPTLVDDEFALGESRAIMRYLADKYSQSDPNTVPALYPDNVASRARVEEWLDWDCGTLMPRQSRAFEPLLTGQTKLDAKAEEKFRAALSLLDTHLESSTYLAGPDLTLADISVLATLTFAEAAEFNWEPYPAVRDYLDRCKSVLPCYEDVNGEPVKRFTAYLKSLQQQAGSEPLNEEDSPDSNE